MAYDLYPDIQRQIAEQQRRLAEQERQRQEQERQWREQERQRQERDAFYWYYRNQGSTRGVGSILQWTSRDR